MNRQQRWAVVVTLIASGLCPGDEKPKERSLPVKLGKVPELRLASRPAPTEAQVKKIKDLIAGLAALERPDYGLSATMSGDAFSPLPGQSRATTFMLTNHDLKPSEGVRALVALGPDSLPFLLNALDDKTPTKMTVKHSGGFGGMSHAAELHLNPVNPAEAATYKARADKPRDEQDVSEYTLKVGDVCFVAIGQIVGRSYQAVRYQPTACIMLNCPAHDAKLCGEVREIWKSKDPVKTLFDSLLVDYATEGAVSKEFPDSWDAGSRPQCSASLRLLYYFPKESAEMIAQRLDKLDVSEDGDVNAYIRRCTTNKVRSEDFIRSVAWCQDKAVKAALVRLFRRAEDIKSLLAAIRAVDDRELIRKRVEPLIAKLPAEERGPYGSGYELLSALGQRTPDTAKPVFQSFLKDASAQRCHTVCLVLRRVELDFNTELLTPLLDDKRTWGWTYAVEEGKNEPRAEIRVCDEAALTLSHNHSEFKFVQRGTHKELDAQITVIREQSKRKK